MKTASSPGRAVLFLATLAMPSTAAGQPIAGATCGQDFTAAVSREQATCAALEDGLANLERAKEKVASDFSRYGRAASAEAREALGQFGRDLVEKAKELRWSVLGRLAKELPPNAQYELAQAKTGIDIALGAQRGTWEPRDLRGLLEAIDGGLGVACTYSGVVPLPPQLVVACATRKTGKKIVSAGLLVGSGWLTAQEYRTLLGLRSDERFVMELLGARIQGLRSELRGCYIRTHNLQRDREWCARRGREETAADVTQYFLVSEEVDGWKPLAEAVGAPSTLARPELMPDDIEAALSLMMAAAQDAEEVARLLQLSEMAAGPRLRDDLPGLVSDLEKLLKNRTDWASYVSQRTSELRPQQTFGDALQAALGSMALQLASSNWNGVLNRQLRSRLVYVPRCYDTGPRQMITAVGPLDLPTRICRDTWGWIQVPGR